MKYLSLLTVVPLLGALVVAFVPRSKPEVAKLLALVFSLGVFGLAVATWFAFDPGSSERLQLRESYTWIPAWGAQFTFAVDGIALVMLALTALLVPIVILASWKDLDNSGKRSVPAYFALILALEGMMIGTFAAADVLLFYLFFEVMLVPMYFLIGSFGQDVPTKQRQYAAVKFFLYSLVGGLVMLAAVVGLWVVGGKTFEWASLVNADLSTGVERWLFLGFFLAFAVKAPFFPFHTWLPDAGGAAPAGAAALLVGVMDKVGTFGILRYCLSLFPDASRYFAPMAIALSLVGIIYAALLAVGQNDLKRLVSYTSIAHFGFIGIGIFAFTLQAGSGAVLYMLNHGLATGLLFLGRLGPPVRLRPRRREVYQVLGRAWRRRGQGRGPQDQREAQARPRPLRPHLQRPRLVRRCPGRQGRNHLAGQRPRQGLLTRLRLQAFIRS
jgi:NADH-quinone oxidoreductase subunit M